MHWIPGLPRYSLGGRMQGMLGNLWLVAASFFFYAWWRVEFVWLLVGEHRGELRRGARHRASRGAGAARRRRCSSCGIAFDLLLLGYFKYANFFLENEAALLSTAPMHLDVILPIGISFFTFTQIAFLVDAHKRKARGARRRQLLALRHLLPAPARRADPASPRDDAAVRRPHEQARAMGQRRARPRAPRHRPRARRC